MNETTKEILKTVADFDGEFKGAYNIRVNGACASRQSTEHIKIETKSDAPGLVVMDEAYTTRRTPQARAASSTLAVPWRLMWEVSSGFSTDFGTDTNAA